MEIQLFFSIFAWDRKQNYIEDFARRLPTDYVDWPKYFHRWFLAMVAQALDINRDYGNSMVPMLIGDQGFKKSNFCKNILPLGMREYYMDDIKMDNAEQVERVLGRMWLLCIDEYNAKTAREQAKIKRILTEKDVQVRKMRSDNRPYQDSSTLEQVLQNLFEPSKIHKKDYFWQVQAIQKELEKHLKSSDVPNLKLLGETIKKLRWPKGGIAGVRGYYLKLKQV